MTIKHNFFSFKTNQDTLHAHVLIVLIVHTLKIEPSVGVNRAHFNQGFRVLGCMDFSQLNTTSGLGSQNNYIVFL